MKYTTEQLIEIIIGNENEDVVNKAFKLGKYKFDVDNLRFICECCNFESVVKLSFKLGKNKFDIDDLKWICESCNFESVVKLSFELGKDKFDIDDLKCICEDCNFESIVKEIKDKYLVEFNPKNITLKDLE